MLSNLNNTNGKGSNAVYGTNLSNTSDAIITERSVANWNGIAEDNATPANVSYPITHLGDTSCVHGDIEVEENLTVTCDGVICHDLTVGNNATLRNATVTGNTQLHNLNVDTRIYLSVYQIHSNGYKNK